MKECTKAGVRAVFKFLLVILAILLGIGLLIAGMFYADQYFGIGAGSSLLLVLFCVAIFSFFIWLTYVDARNACRKDHNEASAGEERG